MLKRLENATASFGERSITPYMRSKAENVRGVGNLVVLRLEDATLLFHLYLQGTVFQTAIGDGIYRARLHFISAYPVIDRSLRLAVASSRRFNIIYVFGQTLLHLS